MAQLPRIRIVVVDDQPLVRRGLVMRLALENDLSVVGEAHTGGEALDLIAQLHPDVVLMDVAMPGMDGLTAVETLHAAHNPTRVIILTIHDDPVMRARALAAGVAAFIGKHEPTERLLSAIRN